MLISAMDVILIVEIFCAFIFIGALKNLSSNISDNPLKKLLFYVISIAVIEIYFVAIGSISFFIYGLIAAIFFIDLLLKW